MLVHFTKMHGLGNDFVVIDNVTQNVFLSRDQIRKLADRHFGIGFDQLLIVEPPYDPDLDFHYRIFNADGNEVEQCGNGARCFSRFVHLKGLTRKHQLGVSTRSGKLMLQQEHNGLVSVDMGVPNFEPAKIPFKAKKAEKTYILRADDQTVLCGVVSLGNPHCVIEVEDLDQAPIDELGAKLCQHSRFPQQANIGFMQVLAPDHIRLRVYERGSGETLACGSGACAAAVIGQQQGKLGQFVRVDLPGGHLQVRWKGGNANVRMTGPAEHVYDGQFHL